MEEKNNISNEDLFIYFVVPALQNSTFSLQTGNHINAQRTYLTLNAQKKSFTLPNGKGIFKISSELIKKILILQVDQKDMQVLFDSNTKKNVCYHVSEISPLYAYTGDEIPLFIKKAFVYDNEYGPDYKKQAIVLTPYSTVEK